MKKIITGLLLVFWTCSSALAAASRDTLSHSAADWIWFAHVSRIEGENSISASEKTETFARRSGPGQGWQAMPPIAGRATAMASRSSQLVLLMADGQWLTLWGEGSATGRPLPADGRILTIADDGENLWAIGSVPGGQAAADAAIALAATTQPSTVPIISDTAGVLSADPATTRASLEPNLVVFRQVDGRWATFSELPHDVSILAEGKVSLALVGGLPMMSYQVGKNVIRTLQWDPIRRWIPAARMNEVSAPVDDFKLFTDGNKPLLWWTSGNSPGELSLDAASSAQPVQLGWKSESNLDGLPTITFYGGFIRLLGPHGGRVLEQRYDDAGAPVGNAAELLVPVETGETSLVEKAEAFFLTAVAFSIGASIFRQWNQTQSPPLAEPPMPAPLLSRLGAGLIDLIPVAAVLIYLFAGAAGNADAFLTPSLGAMELLAGAVALYLLHTTVAEVLTGRTFGKWIFGLKVSTLDGLPAKPGQIVIRNLLRLIDPLVMIAISPLRQRSADVVAGTMVVRQDAIQAKPVDPDSKPENVEKDPK